MCGLDHAGRERHGLGPGGNQVSLEAFGEGHGPSVADPTACHLAEVEFFHFHISVLKFGDCM